MLGLDVLLSGDGCAPRLIEINGNPSLSIEFERETARPGEFKRHVSPVDVAVKRRVLGDALRIAAAGALPDDSDAAALRSYYPVITAANPIPPALSALNECRLLYEVRARRGLSRQDGSGEHALSTDLSHKNAQTVVPAGAEASMTRAQFSDFCRASGLPEHVGLTAVDLEALFTQQCDAQNSAEATEDVMDIPAFTRALIELAALAHPNDNAGLRLRRLLEHIRSYSTRSRESKVSPSPRAPSGSQ